MINDKSPPRLQRTGFVINHQSIVICHFGERTVPSFPKFLFQPFEHGKFALKLAPYSPPHQEIRESPESKNDPEWCLPDPDIAVRMLENQRHTGKNSHDGACNKQNRDDRHTTQLSTLSLQSSPLKSQAT